MRTLIRWVARLYPATWRNRYAAEFDTLLDDISPSLGDLCDVLGDVLRVRATSSLDACLVSAAVSPMTLRLPVVVSLTAHALITLVLLAALGHVTPMPLHVVAPLPPPTPDPPPQVTDARVFPNALTLYSSLPLIPAEGDALSLYVADGVGINFLSLPDIGATYRKGNAEWRVWPGQALEGLIVRRVLPEYPRGTNSRGAVSVFVEYLVTRDGSVKVLRTSGPARFTGAAQSAIEHWVYRPLEYENRPCEVVSRVEVRFDSEFVEPGLSHGFHQLSLE
jgi:Gram-negative bacterial TonB protein C-terminal